MRTAKLTLILALAILLLAGCGSRPPQLQPPIVKLVDLTLQADSADLQLRVRLSNSVPRAMQVRDIRFTVRIGNQLLGDFNSSFSGLLPGLGEEVLTLKGSASAALRASLERLNDTSSRQMLPVTITGSLVAADAQTFDLESEGWLSATPGRPWSYR